MSVPQPEQPYSAPIVQPAASRLPLIAGIIVIGLAALSAILQPVILRLTIASGGTGAFVAVTSFISLVVLGFGLVAIVVGLVSLRRPGSALGAGVALGAGAVVVIPGILGAIANLLAGL